MVEGILRSSPDGSIGCRRGTIAVPQTAVPGSGTATATATFTGARVGDVVSISPRALPIQGAAGLWGASCITADTITLLFGTGGAALTIPANTMDCTIADF
jgi:hypothetical protein